MGCGSALEAGIEVTRPSAQPATALPFVHHNRRHPPLPVDLVARQDPLLESDLHPLTRHAWEVPCFSHREQLESGGHVVHKLGGRNPQALAELVDRGGLRGFFTLFQAGDLLMGQIRLADQFLLIQSRSFAQRAQPLTRMDGIGSPTWDHISGMCLTHISHGEAQGRSGSEERKEPLPTQPLIVRSRRPRALPLSCA